MALRLKWVGLFAPPEPHKYMSACMLYSVSQYYTQNAVVFSTKLYVTKTIVPVVVQVRLVTYCMQLNQTIAWLISD